VNAGPPLAITNAGTYNMPYKITNPAGSYPVTAVFVSNSDTVIGSSGSGTLTVNTEALTIVTPAPFRVQAGAGGVAGFNLSATLKDTDGSTADISRALPSVLLIPAVQNGVSISCPITILNNAGQLALTAVCSKVPVQAYFAYWKIDGNYYTGTAYSVVSVFDASGHYIAGAGRTQDKGVPADFAFSFASKGTWSGGLVYLEHAASGDKLVSTTSTVTVLPGSDLNTVSAMAKVNGRTGFVLQAQIDDNGAAGSDRFGLTVSGTPDPAIAFSPALLTSGDVVAH
jgi:hypothetical protein